MNWLDFINEEKQHKYFQEIQEEIKNDSSRHFIVPSEREFFAPFLITPFNKIKVVIVNDTPYGDRSYDDGLALSSKTRVTPELINLYKKIENDLDIKCNYQGSLRKWATQGVFLLNMHLTAREGAPRSHMNLGWENFTLKVLSILNNRPEPIVFIFLGKRLSYIAKEIKSHHLAIVHCHPSPIKKDDSFMEKDLFNITNEFLINNNYSSIDWR